MSQAIIKRIGTQDRRKKHTISHQELTSRRAIEEAEFSDEDSDEDCGTKKRKQKKVKKGELLQSSNLSL